MAHGDKQRHKVLRKQWQADERARLVASMPLSAAQLHELLDYLDEHFESCDRTLKLTARFVTVAQLDADKVLPWLAGQGGYCDCEVLMNLADLDESLQAPPPMTPTARQPKPKREARDLSNAAGWDLSNLPAPWRIANLYQPGTPLQLQLGKKAGCTLELLERPLSPGDRAADETWSGLWYARTELPARGPLQIAHGVLDLPAPFRSTLVRSPNWSPVFCWIVGDTDVWHLEVRTDSARYAGDLPQIAALIRRLARLSP